MIWEKSSFFDTEFSFPLSVKVYFLVTNKEKNGIRIPTNQKNFQTSDLRHGPSFFKFQIKFCTFSKKNSLLLRQNRPIVITSQEYQIFCSQSDKWELKELRFRDNVQHCIELRQQRYPWLSQFPIDTAIEDLRDLSENFERTTMHQKEKILEQNESYRKYVETFLRREKMRMEEGLVIF